LFIVITCCELATAALHTIAGAGKTPSPTLVEAVDAAGFLLWLSIDSADKFPKTGASTPRSVIAMLRANLLN
jgi:hypothetical protein